jgi:hypothetical protein
MAEAAVARHAGDRVGVGQPAGLLRVGRRAGDLRGRRAEAGAALAAAHDRIYTYSLPLEDARAQAAYGQHSQVGKILEIHTELPGRIHVVLIRQQVGY